MNGRLFLAGALLVSLAGTARALTPEELPGRREEVSALLAAHDPGPAEQAARTLLAETEISFGEEAAEVAGVIDLLVDARLGQRAVDEECLALAERAVRIREASTGPEAPETAESLRRLGFVLLALARTGDAAAPLERALAILEKRFGRGSDEAAPVLGKLARVYRDLDRDREAAEMLEETVGLLTHRDAAPSVLSPLLYNLAVAEWTLGDFDASERHYRELLDITPEESGQRAAIHNGLGSLHLERGRYPEAQEAYERAVAIARETGAHPGTLAYYLNNLGFLLAEMGDYEGAIRIYSEALELRRATDGARHPNTAATLANLGDAHRRAGDPLTARRLHEEALSIRTEVFGPEHTAVAASLGELAMAHLDLGEPEEARACLERALSIRIRHLGEDHYDTARLLAPYAAALRETGNRERAEETARRAMTVLEAALGRDNPAWSEACLELAGILAESGKRDEAWSLALEAESKTRRHAVLTASALSERQALRYASITKRALDLVLSLLPGQQDDAVAVAWDRVIRSRAMVLDVVAARKAYALAEQDDETGRTLREFRETSRRLASLLVRGPGEDPTRFRGDLDQARDARERAERELARIGVRGSLAGSRLGFPDVVEALPPGGGLLAYVRYDRRPSSGTSAAHEAAYLAFMLRPGDRAPTAIELGPASEIDSLVAAWRREAVGARSPESADGQARYLDAAFALRRSVWDPVRTPGGDPLFVVPDGTLHRVNLYALPADSSRYLVETDLRLHLLSAERDLVRDDSGSANGRGLLSVGGVDFGVFRPEARDGPLGVEFPPLPATSEEAEGVAELWREASPGSGDEIVLLTGPAATESAVKRLLPGRDTVHLATHGFFFGREAAAPAGDRRSISGVSGRRPAADAALTLSGLALAGANRGAPDDRGDDGILTSEEIAAIDLSGVRWVVLSACDTGLGAVQNGEGVLGLRRAFEVSGVASLFMSLWEVDDRASRHWMEALYRSRFEAGLSTVDSCREAARSVLTWSRDRLGTSHPYTWGAFVAVGDWR